APPATPAALEFSPPMARADTRLEPAPRIPPVTALKTVARAGRFLRPYRRQIVFAAIGLVVAAAAVLAVGQGLKFVVDRLCRVERRRARSHAGTDARRHRRH